MTASGWHQEATGRWISDDGRWWWNGVTGRPAPVPTKQRVYWLLASAFGCLLALGALILIAWLEVTFTPADQCASETCGDIWLFPVFIGPWLVAAAIALLLVAWFTVRSRRRLLRDGLVGDATPPDTSPPTQSQTPAPGYLPTSAVATARLANPGLRIVGGLIDLGVLIVIDLVIDAFLGRVAFGTFAGIVELIADFAYFGYFWSVRGQSPGMMPFGFKVRDLATSQYPSVGKAILRGFIWGLEVFLTALIIGAIGWLWQLWDPQRQAVHDKAAGTVVTVR